MGVSALAANPPASGDPIDEREAQTGWERRGALVGHTAADRFAGPEFQRDRLALSPVTHPVGDEL